MDTETCCPATRLIANQSWSPLKSSVLVVLPPTVSPAVVDRSPAISPNAVPSLERRGVPAYPAFLIVEPSFKSLCSLGNRLGDRCREPADRSQVEIVIHDCEILLRQRSAVDHESCR